MKKTYKSPVDLTTVVRAYDSASAKRAAREVLEYLWARWGDGETSAKTSKAKLAPQKQVK